MAVAQTEGYGAWIKEEVPVKTPGKQTVVTVPKLTLRWQILTLDKQNQELAAASSREFVDGDWVRVAVQVNQAGYLYIINHTIERDGKLTRPTLISKKLNKVAKDRIVELPALAGCPSRYQRNNKCWWRMRKPEGREVITIIFSRNQVNEFAEAASKSAEEDVYVSDDLIFRLTQKSPEPKRQPWSPADQRRYKLQGIMGDHVTMVWNPNARNNEVLVERLEYNHR